MSSINLKFLTHQLADQVARQTVMHVLSNFPVSRQEGHIVVLAPQLLKDEIKRFPANYTLTPTVLYQNSFGERDNWEHRYDEIAQCKSLQLWQRRNTPSNMTSQAYMLFDDDTPYWGGHSEGLLTVAFSGVQPFFDQMISKMVVAQLIALSEYDKGQWIAINPDKDFV